MNNERYSQIVKGAEPTLAEHREGWHWCGTMVRGGLFFFTCCKGEFCQYCKYIPRLAGPY